MLSPSTIDSVRDLPIHEVIGKWVTLKKAGVNYKGLSPFSNEKTPSFNVNSVKGFFKDFSSGHGGDAIQFVMLHQKLPFVEAVELIAKDFGIEVKHTEEKCKTPEEINELKIAADLLEHAKNEYLKARPHILNYLLIDRQLTLGTVIQWQLGYAPDWKVITPYLIANGYYSIAEKFGLVRKAESGNVYDFYHHRITIPIHNASGQLVGFGGRLMPGAEGAKYFNPVDSPIYNKSKTLFGLNKARSNFSNHGGAVLVEGYFDVIKLHQCGWDNAIASCGTALTPEQAKLIKKYTDTVYIMRDGDRAGKKAMLRDIPILLQAQLKVYCIELPEKEDPDSLFSKGANAVYSVCVNYVDAVEFSISNYLNKGLESPSEMADAIEKAVKLLADIDNQVRRERYIQSIINKNNPWKLKTSDLTKPLDKLLGQRLKDAEAKEALEDDEFRGLPSWADKKELFEHGFCQLTQYTKGYKVGVYVNDGNGKLIPITNFSIKPLYHIYESSNNRRMVEVDNGDRNAVVEMPSNAFINQNVFEACLIEKGNFQTLHTFNKKYFKLMIGWLGYKTPMAYELKTLGWQPEGFFAFTNAVYHEGNLIEYDDLGMIKVEDRIFMSLANSRLHSDERNTDNPYENDLYLKHVATDQTIRFSQWAKLFAITYGENAPFGIAFAFLTLFKDVVTRTAKMPMLYCFGPKGSGKSAMAESITWLFFSGKNGEGDLIKGYNLNPGQGTPFSFFNRVERFRNCPILFNEFDENNIEEWKFGTFKAAYDGEGREVGDGDTGKKRKTKIQKVQGTVIIVGQYLSVKDDGSVLSRSITNQFSLERVTNLTKEENEAYEQLKKAENIGLSGILTELLHFRPEIAKRFATEFANVQLRMINETRNLGQRVEARLISNYSLVCTASKLMHDLGLALPYSFEDFFEVCTKRVIAHNRMLKDNNSIHQFWKTVSVLFDLCTIRQGYEVMVSKCIEVRLKDGSGTTMKRFNMYTTCLFVRFENVYSSYAKHFRERSGSPALGEESLIMYLKEQPYYIGLSVSETFTDKRTSSYVFNYEMLEEMGIVLEKNYTEPQPKQTEQLALSEKPPF